MKGLFLALGAMTLTAIVLITLHKNHADSQYTEQFMAFKTKYNKSYGSSSEMKFRLSVFSQNMNLIKKSNADKSKTFTSGVTLFADMTFEEFTNQYLMKPVANKHKNVLTSGPLPRGNVDWRQKSGVVSEVRDQGQCGSCWAFSTVASTESTRFLFDGTSTSLSEQELVDCASSYGNYGCNGGLMPYAFDYIVDNGISTRAQYPYRGYQNYCQSSYTSTRYNIKSYNQISPVDVTGLMSATNDTVVAVAFEATQELMHYTGGIYNPDSSCGLQLNHAVNAVGYNSEADVPYFIVRNSWSAAWGEAGYFRMTIGSGSGSCGIANETCTYPTF